MVRGRKGERGRKKRGSLGSPAAVVAAAATAVVVMAAAEAVVTAAAMVVAALKEEEKNEGEKGRSVQARRDENGFETHQRPQRWQ